MYTPRSIKKLLIANRGEIAIRVIRTCRDLGIETVAVYSEADRNGLHVRMADEAYCVGEAPSKDSYLRIDTIIDTALRCNVQAIHPGYGFLSENAIFAEACEASGLLFVGPPPSAIRSMGDKTTARLMMQDAGVRLVPGTKDAIEDVAQAAEVADGIGYPVLIKAAAGGGGKGMRRVDAREHFVSALETAQREAETAFGDGRVFVEKYIVEPRHIEIQVLFDQHGHGVHLFERECSIQRRHQKVIEEAPSSILTPEVRQEMGEAALKAAATCGYVNAGTVEFLVDDQLNYYFMEMNTRLQVEHPVTEMITGLDLVAEQLRIAEGEPLGYGQDDIPMLGHAIECRIYAEDTLNNFLPSPGTLLLHRPPAGPGVRVDAGVDFQGEIPLYYDPMISKLITHAPSREEAIRRMSRALHEYQVAGVSTTIPFCAFAVDHDAFKNGKFSTHFVAEHYNPATMQHNLEEEEIAAALAAVLHYHQSNKSNGSHLTDVSAPTESPWRRRI